MGEGGVAGQLTQNRLHVGLTDPCQAAVGSLHCCQRVDDHLQLRCEHAGVGVGQKPLGGCAEHAALASSAAVELGFVAATDAVDVELDATTAPACGLAIDKA